MTTIEFILKLKDKGPGWFVQAIRITRITPNGEVEGETTGTAGTTWKHGNKAVDALAGLLALYKHQASICPSPWADPVGLCCDEGTPAGRIAQQVQSLLSDSRREDAISRVPWVTQVFESSPLDSLLDVHGGGPFTVELKPELSISDVSFLTDQGPLSIDELKELLALRSLLDRPPSVDLTGATDDAQWSVMLGAGHASYLLYLRGSCGGTSGASGVAKQSAARLVLEPAQRLGLRVSARLLDDADALRTELEDQLRAKNTYFANVFDFVWRMYLLLLSQPDTDDFAGGTQNSGEELREVLTSAAFRADLLDQDCQKLIDRVAHGLLSEEERNNWRSSFPPWIVRKLAASQDEA